MKKTIITALALAATLSLISPVANAAQNQGTQPNSMTTASSSTVPTTLSEIKGTIESLQHHCMTVKGEDSKLYVIPILAFEKTEEFKQLNLKEGTVITAKGYIKMSPGAFTVTIADANKAPLSAPKSQVGEIEATVSCVDVNNDDIFIMDINSILFTANEISTGENTIKLEK